MTVCCPVWRGRAPVGGTIRGDAVQAGDAVPPVCVTSCCRGTATRRGAMWADAPRNYQWRAPTRAGERCREARRRVTDSSPSFRRSGVHAHEFFASSVLRGAQCIGTGVRFVMTRYALCATVEESLSVWLLRKNGNQANRYLRDSQQCAMRSPRKNATREVAFSMLPVGSASCSAFSVQRSTCSDGDCSAGHDRAGRAIQASHGVC